MPIDNLRLAIVFLSSFLSFRMEFIHLGSFTLVCLWSLWLLIWSYINGAKLPKCRVDKIRWTRCVSANVTVRFCQIITTVEILAGIMSTLVYMIFLHMEGRGGKPSIICPHANIASFCNLHCVLICCPSCAHFASSPQCPGTIAVAIVPLWDNDCIEIQIEYWREKRLKAGDILR